MKYLRRQNLNASNVLDDTVLQRADGNIELNPTEFVIINGDIAFDGGNIYSKAETFNLLNKDSAASLIDDGPTTINAFLNADTISFGSTTSNTNFNGNLSVIGNTVSTSQLIFNLLNTTATTVNAFGESTTLNLGAATGTTTVNNDLQVNGNTTLGIDSSNSNIYWGLFTANIRDNVSTSLEIKESNNSYINIDTSNSAELISFGVISKIEFNNVTEASSATDASAVFFGGVGISKNLYVGTDLTVLGNATIGDNRAVDVHAVNGTLIVDVPSNTATALEIKENTTSYIRLVTAAGSENVTIGQVPKLLINNTTDSINKDSGSLIIEGGVGIEKNVFVGGSVYSGANVGFADAGGTIQVYQQYNSSTDSLDTVFG